MNGDFETFSTDNNASYFRNSPIELHGTLSFLRTHLPVTLSIAPLRKVMVACKRWLIKIYMVESALLKRFFKALSKNSSTGDTSKPLFASGGNSFQRRKARSNSIDSMHVDSGGRRNVISTKLARSRSMAPIRRCKCFISTHPSTSFRTFAWIIVLL